MKMNFEFITYVTNYSTTITVRAYSGPEGTRKFRLLGFKTLGP
jgi:hypothetical protein